MAGRAATMTSPIGMIESDLTLATACAWPAAPAPGLVARRTSDRPRAKIAGEKAPRSGFTLVELILVMALLAIVMAFSAPALSRSMRERHLTDEAARFLALTEYARSEAISQGVPLIVWIDPAAGRFGVEPKAGFTGAEQRIREFALDTDIHFEITDGEAKRGIVEAAEFAPDGSLESGSMESLRLLDRFGSAITVARTDDQLGYEILTEGK